MRRRERERQQDPSSVPETVGDEADLVVVDTTWGEMQPIQVAEGIRTVGELELVEQADSGALLVDCRTPGSFGGRTIPGSVNIPHEQVVERAAELGEDRLAILFCNGPQCPQSPQAIHALLDAGRPASTLAYYRGGMHDWVTLAMPTEPVDD